METKQLPNFFPCHNNYLRSS